LSARVRACVRACVRTRSLMSFSLFRPSPSTIMWTWPDFYMWFK
jgi:hypothetical protein